MRDPSWRAAIVGAGQDAVQALSVAAATALLVVSASASVLVVWTAGQAAVERLEDTTVVQQGSFVGLDVVVAVPNDLPDPLAAALAARIDEFVGFEPAQRETRSIGWLVRSGANAVRPVVRAGDQVVPAVLHQRAGAIASLDVVAGPSPGGEVWLPATLAEELGLEPGDTFDVGLEPLGGDATATSARTSLAGTYATVDGRPAGLLRDAGVRLPPDPDDRSEPASLVLADVATMRRLGAELGDLQLSSLQAPATRPPRYEDLRQGVEQLDAFERDLFNTSSELGTMIFDAYDGPEVRVATGARQLVTVAARTADAVGDQVTGTATAGLLVAAATLVAAVFAGARRRREETRLELVQGSAPLAVAAQATLAQVPGVLIGAVLGRLVVLPVAAAVLPVARVPQPAVAALTPRAAAVAAGALLLVLVVRWVDAAARLATLGGRERRRAVPVVPVLLAATAVVVLGVAIGPARPPTDPLLMVLPVLVIASTAVVALRLVVRLLPRTVTPGREPTSWWLARRRLAGQPDRFVAIGAAVATAAGLVANTSVLFASGGVAVEAKAAAVAGAEVVVADPDRTIELGPGRTLVLQDDDVDVLPEQVRARLLVVDPATFSTTAAWPAGTDPGVLTSLTAADSTSLPVLVVDGPTPIGDSGTLQRSGWWDLPYEVVGRPAALPGIDPGQPLLVTTQDAVFARLDAGLDPRQPASESGERDDPWAVQVWTSDTGTDGSEVAATTGLGTGTRVVRTLDEVRTQPTYLATTWSLGVLGGLGVVVLVLALLLLGASRPRDADEAGLELAVLVRLGVPEGLQARSAVLERVLLVVVAGAIGVVTGTVLTAAVLGGADPAPSIAPALALVVPAGVLGGLAAVLVVGGAVAGLLDHRAARRTDIEEALRVAR